MSEEYCIRVSDEVDEQLQQLPDEEIRTSLMETLERLAERDETIQQQQDELHDRMDISTDEDTTEELSETELKREIQRFIRGDRRTDPRLDT